MIALMVGGPVHGKAWEVPEPLPWTLCVPRTVEWSILDYTTDGPVKPPPEPHTYNLRRYNPPLGWRGRLRDHGPQPAYVCVDPPAKIRLPRDASEDDAYYAQAAETLWHQVVEATIPACVVPDCTEKGRMRFQAAERGRLAGREWEPGDEIPICHPHAHDIYLAQGVYGIDQLADWLKPDARYDALDWYDIGADLLSGDQIRNSRARMLRLAQRGRP